MVLDELRRSADEDAQMLRLALHCIVEHGEELLIIALPRHTVGNFVQINAFVNEQQQALVADSGGKFRPQLHIIVPVVVIDNDAHTQCIPGFRAGRELAAQPAKSVLLEILIPELMAVPV
ncbi:hypothetical protein D3C73_1397400 [compost metagenome]